MAGNREQKSPCDKESFVRDRDVTETKLIRAVGTLLAREGFTGMGVNAVAREAGVDKVLIYRYFGGLEELMQAYAQEGDFWPGLEEFAGGDPLELSGLEPKERLVVILKNYLRAIRKRPLTQEILAWELVERNELTKALDDVRKKVTAQLISTFGLPSDKKGELDGQALISLLAGGITYLVTRAKNNPGFAGLEFADKDTWRRLELTMEHIVCALVEDVIDVPPPKTD